MIEKGGVVWVYMGPKEHMPPEPEYEFASVPLEQTFSSKRIQECNWLQAMEGGIDSSHVSFLHRFTMNKDPLFKGAEGNKYNLKDSKLIVRKKIKLILIKLKFLRLFIYMCRF